MKNLINFLEENQIEHETKIIFLEKIDLKKLNLGENVTRIFYDSRGKLFLIERELTDCRVKEYYNNGTLETKEYYKGNERIY